MSCVTATPPTHHPHPHRLVGQDCVAGVSRIVIDRVQQPQTPVQSVVQRFVCLTSYVIILYKCKKLNSFKHLVRTTVAGSHN